MAAKYSDEACVALVAVQLECSLDTSTYIVGCASPEEVKTLLLEEYEPGPPVEIIVSKLSADDAKGLKLMPKEIRPWN
jgi:hypothetical protein